MITKPKCSRCGKTTLWEKGIPHPLCRSCWDKNLPPIPTKKFRSQLKIWKHNYYLAHQEEIKTKSRKYHHANKKKCNARSRAYAISHKEEKREYDRLYRLSHADEIKVRNHDYYLKRISQKEKLCIPVSPNRNTPYI